MWTERSLSWWMMGLSLAGCAASPGVAGADTVSAADTGGAGPDARLLVVYAVESRSPGGDPWAYADVGNPPFAAPAGPAALERGACAYHPQLVPVPCESACTAPEFCGVDGTCQRHEERYDAGAIVVTGLKSAVTLTPSGPYFYYAATLEPEPADGELFDAGSEITASGAGTAMFPAFQATGVGVADLVAALPCQLDPRPDEDLTVTWEPASNGAGVRFVMQSGNHGEQFSRIVCEAPDTGTLRVDAELLALYLADQRPLEAWRLSRTASRETTQPGARVRVEATSTVGCMY